MYNLIFLGYLLMSIVTTNAPQERPIKLDYFKETPSEIDGCSESFTYDSISLKHEKYIAITNLQKLAFIRVNGITIRLTLFEKKHPSDKEFISTYKCDGYTIIISTILGKQIADEEWLDSGTMKILKGNLQSVLKIHGVGGC
jgi:hypothetical protein